MKIAFYYSPMGNRKINATELEQGNPGIGGTDYQMMLLGHYLSKRNFEIYALSKTVINFADEQKYIKIQEKNLIETINNLELDVLIIPNLHLHILYNKKINDNIKIIVHAHNNLTLDNLRYISKSNNIKVCICVGKQMYDRYIDSDVIKKTKCIFNIVADPCKKDISRNINSKIVVYMGSIVKLKGFLVLAKMWKGILKKVPSAKLYVIGSGKLYNSDTELGTLGIAEKCFENEFLPYISDENGLLPNIKFLGILGKEKYDVFSNASVGVANPTGRTETFCITVSEMNCMQLPVATINKSSFPDVIINGQTGLLGKNNMEIENNIVKLLCDYELNEKLGLQAKEFVKNFSPQKIIPQWEELLEQVYNGTFKPKYEPPSPPFNNRFKWLHIINRFLRFNCKLSFLPAIVNIQPRYRLNKLLGVFNNLIWRVFSLNMRILFICSSNVNDKANGGGMQCTQRNYQAVCNFFGKENVTVLNLYEHYTKNKLMKKICLLMLRYYGLDLKNEKIVLSLAKDSQFVFLDSSSYGILSCVIKNKYPSKKVITFFHNFEYEYIKRGKPFDLLNQKVIYFNEKCACKYSDKIIVLNKRDEFAINSLYKRKADAVIPVSFENKSINFNKNIIENNLTALFLGSNFFANTHGINWFIKDVLPFVNIKLKIVGRDMDKADLPKNEKLEVIGYIENLDECIQNADFMIFPIFKGSGMKVKTCEALMHGKNIIGTGEAFEGYDVDFERVGAKCETAEEFIIAINEFPKRFSNKFNEYSRNVFLEKYRNEVTFGQFAEVFKI